MRPLPPRTPGIWSRPAKATTQCRKAPVTMAAPAATAVSPTAVRQLRHGLTRRGRATAVAVRPLRAGVVAMGGSLRGIRGDRAQPAGQQARRGPAGGPGRPVTALAGP